jgi:hypothetical protein
VSELYSLGTDRRENTSSEQTAEKTPIVACLAITKERILPLLTRQAYSVHVTICYRCEGCVVRVQKRKNTAVVLVIAEVVVVVVVIIAVVVVEVVE